MVIGFSVSKTGSVRGFFIKTIRLGPVVLSVFLTVPWPSVSSCRRIGKYCSLLYFRFKFDGNVDNSIRSFG